jgi:hypothetical protein
MSNDMNLKNKHLICERIELISEYAIWGDQNNGDIWEYFK